MHQQLNRCSVSKTNLIAENLQIMQLWAVITAKQRVQEQKQKKQNIKTQQNPLLPGKAEMITWLLSAHIPREESRLSSLHEYRFTVFAFLTSDGISQSIKGLGRTL